MKKQWMCLLLCAGLVTFASARKIGVDAGDASDLTTAAKNAVAGDTILVPPGTYNLTSSICSATADSFKGSGRDQGCLWVGNSGTSTNPIMIVGTDASNPPNIVGPGVSGNYYYTAHITGDYVILKNLKLSSGSKVLIIDAAEGVTVEDCEITNSGTEILHVRDASKDTHINRNFIHGSGLVTGKYGEGVYIGSYSGSWRSKNSGESAYWGSDANGYDWRVTGTAVSCNVIKATTAEPIDVKEGVPGVTITGNMFVADWLATESDAPSYDDAYIDMKGVNAVVTGNYMYDAKDASLPFYNPKFKYFVEEVSKNGNNVTAWGNAQGKAVEPDAYAQTGWCDNSANDNNQCFEKDNHVVKKIIDVRDSCKEMFPIPGGYEIKYNNVNFAAADEARLPNAGNISSSSTPGSSSSNSGGTTKTTRYEAESASHGTAEVKTHKDASNGSYVFVKDQDVVFNVNVATAGTYDVLVRFSNTASNAKTQTIQVNGTKVMDKEFPVTLEGNVGGANAKFEDMVLSLSLKAGSNTIGFIKNWGYVDLDYVEITETVAAISAKRASMNFRATVQGRSLQIQSATVGAPYAVMDMQGRVVKSGSIGAASMVLPMPTSGNYLVRVGSQIQRISVK